MNAPAASAMPTSKYVFRAQFSRYDHGTDNRPTTDGRTSATNAYHSGHCCYCYYYYYYLYPK